MKTREQIQEQLATHEQSVIESKNIDDTHIVIKDRVDELQSRVDKDIHRAIEEKKSYKTALIPASKPPTESHIQRDRLSLIGSLRHHSAADISAATFIPSVTVAHGTVKDRKQKWIDGSVKSSSSSYAAVVGVVPQGIVGRSVKQLKELTQRAEVRKAEAAPSMPCALKYPIKRGIEFVETEGSSKLDSIVEEIKKNPKLYGLFEQLDQSEITVLIEKLKKQDYQKESESPNKEIEMVVRP